MEEEIEHASERAAKEYVYNSPSIDWSDSDQEWVKAIFQTAFVKGAIWEKQKSL